MDLKPGCFGVTIHKSPDFMRSPCVDCPFTAEKQGRGYLTEERMEGIKFAFTAGQPFFCHKVVYGGRTKKELDPTTGEEHIPNYAHHYKVCAGAIEYAEALARELGVEPLVIENPVSLSRK